MTTISFEIEKWSENNNQNVDHSEIYLMIDNQCGGLIRIDNETGKIEYVEIYSKFRGKGFYKMLLIATLNLTGFESLSSNDRNSYSNPAYKKWCNNENLLQSTDVIISLSNEELIFTY